MRPYLPSDYPEVAGWYRARGEQAPPPEALPKLGCFEPGVAALFAYRTDATVAILDAGITNPAAPMRARARALDEALAMLASELSREGFRHLLGSTQSRGFIRMGMRNGFKDAGQYTTMARAL